MKFRETKEDIDDTGYLQPKLYIGPYSASTHQELAADLISEFKLLKNQRPKFESGDVYVYEFDLRVGEQLVTEREFWRSLLKEDGGIVLLTEFIHALGDGISSPWWISQQMDDCGDAAGIIPIQEAIDSLDGFEQAKNFFPMFWYFLNEMVDMEHEVEEDSYIKKMLDLLDVGPRRENRMFMDLLMFRLLEGQLSYNAQEKEFYDKYIGPVGAFKKITLPEIVRRLEGKTDLHFCIPHMLHLVYGRVHKQYSEEIVIGLVERGYTFTDQDTDTSSFDKGWKKIFITERDRMIEESRVPLYTGYHTYNPDSKSWTRT